MKRTSGTLCIATKGTVQRTGTLNGGTCLICDFIDCLQKYVCLLWCKSV